ncbi:MAG: response regulator [Gemmatimonadetes bacterium]|nr:sigma-54-dependent Fis family transcriptional regulator [Gemmatimonadota bacterium]NIR76903.1 sigma-54-dependent Fis family transcriptional regulator [Gemmatimonadota bacterium]NIT85424.1 sigma-54-dependent Fis family transcriptional regulator [Gemmatimonadota bacterium]NIU29245.1 sigma-54-dependent Fis family transcriptional regulator [Gemmatimonadota bacterium]NIU34331.1 response regulator [Gemmatimonadota bacterium]
MSEETRVLILDDEPEMLENLDRMLSGEGYSCWTLSDPEGFRELRARVDPDVLITDLRMPGADGMTILAAARADDPSLPVILITGYGTVSSAVDAMHEGAFDYLTKPFTVDALLVSVERAARHRRLVQENRTLREEVRRGSRTETVIGSSPAFVRILERAQKVAPTDATVLITGESGTGKEVLARLVHDLSRRAEGRFVPVDCAALPEGLLESELFGHEEGAFTGAVSRRDGLIVEADGGTLFLDEIGDLSVPLQSKLLRVLEERQVRRLGDSRLVDVDIRLVAATNANLKETLRDGSFREDLYYRLNVVGLELPPLRARRDDIPLLAGRFLEEFAASTGKEVPEVSPEAWRVLERYDWPGNIRQLRNVVHRLVALDEDGLIAAGDLPTEIRFPATDRARLGVSGNGMSLDYERAREEAKLAFRATYLERLLDAHDGNISQAARTAGVSRRTIHRWIADLEGRREEEAGDEDE